MLDIKEKHLKWKNPGSSTQGRIPSADSSGDAVQWKDISEMDKCWAESQRAASLPPLPYVARLRPVGQMPPIGSVVLPADILGVVP